MHQYAVETPNSALLSIEVPWASFLESLVSNDVQTHIYFHVG